MPPRNASAQIDAAPEVLTEIVIPAAERESVDNEFFVFSRYVEGPLKAALLRGGLPKGDITVTISRK